MGDKKVRNDVKLYILPDTHGLVILRKCTDGGKDNGGNAGRMTKPANVFYWQAVDNVIDVMDYFSSSFASFAVMRSPKESRRASILSNFLSTVSNFVSILSSNLSIL